MAPELEYNSIDTFEGVSWRDGVVTRSTRLAVPAATVRETAHSSWRRGYVATLLLADGAAVTIGALVAQLLRFDTVDATARPSGAMISYFGIAFLLAPVWVLALALGGVYEPRRLGAGSEEYRRIFDSSVRLLAGIAIIALVLKLDLARGFVALALPLATAFTVTGHYVARQWLFARRARGACVQRVLVVGHEHQAADLVRHLRRASHAGLSVVGACVPSGGSTLDVDGVAVPVLGGPERILDALARCGADTVAVADHDTLRNGALRRLGWSLEGSGVDLLVAPTVTDVAGPRIAIRPVAGLPLLHVEEPELSGVARLAKEWVERFLAGVLLLVISPFLLFVGIAVRFSSAGPALFRQVRVGQGGRHFTIYKFRTMVASAEAEQADLEEHNEHDGLLFKIREDPRRTHVGRFLRRFSLDELPQLWNVVVGHMSIVGPRPPLPSEVALYSDELHRRLLVKPGLTGLWQVSGRANLPWEEAVRLDLYYVENWSPALDLVILCKTVTAVVRGRGAY